MPRPLAPETVEVPDRRPETTTVSTTLEQLGEVDLIRRLTARLTPGKGVSVGPGDDCAVVSLPGTETELVLTSDPVIEGRHFLRGTEPGQIGHKAVGRVLSDLAAMGAEPRWGLVDVVAPPGTTVDFLEGVYAGIKSLADAHGFCIVGGDVAGATPFALHLFGTGTVPRGQALLRSGAAPHQAIYVTGELGGSRSGRHLCFKPRVAEGIRLREWATAMIDISDGLATDLRHLCESSEVGARIEPEAIPLAPAATTCDDDRSPIRHALEDGEDFELLFTVPEGETQAFEAAWSQQSQLRCTKIGMTTPANHGIVCTTEDGDVQPLESMGYDHFAR